MNFQVELTRQMDMGRVTRVRRKNGDQPKARMLTSKVMKGMNAKIAMKAVYLFLPFSRCAKVNLPSCLSAENSIIECT